MARIITEGILATQCTIYQISYRVVGRKYEQGDKYPCIYVIAAHDGVARKIFQDGTYNRPARSSPELSKLELVDVQSCRVSDLPFFEKECLFHT